MKRSAGDSLIAAELAFVLVIMLVISASQGTLNTVAKTDKSKEQEVRELYNPKPVTLANDKKSVSTKSDANSAAFNTNTLKVSYRDGLLMVDGKVKTLDETQELMKKVTGVEVDIPDELAVLMGIAHSHAMSISVR